MVILASAMKIALLHQRCAIASTWTGCVAENWQRFTALCYKEGGATSASRNSTSALPVSLYLTKESRIMATSIILPPPSTEWQLSNKFMVEESTSPAYTIRITKPVLAAYSDDAFNHSLDSYLATTVTGFKTGAKEAGSVPTSSSSWLEITYDLLASGGGILSLRFLISSYGAGAAHPIHYLHTLTYDLNRGMVMTLDSLFKPNTNYLDVLASYCTVDLQRRGLLNFPEGTAPKPDNYQNWNIERGGLLITFDEGLVGPFAQGPTDVWIPYRTVADLVQTEPPPAWWWY
jgi:hypothetical protein